MADIEWESIGEFMSRARTPTGWLVREYSDVAHFPGHDGRPESGWDFRVALTFVPDPDGVWLAKGDSDG